MDKSQKSKNVDKNVDSENVDLTRFLRGQTPFVHVFLQFLT
nr:MAG TPA: hypothetical protein [Caudoviricetes sp.]